ncbi:FAD-dependent oxidoreductase [Pseudomonas sp.]|uniref:NAD(P)/FAD-dependent oxidoreductase n=1 Tax=Pseudomonas sp. TaxID=306 RepID=UPI0031B6081E
MNSYDVVIVGGGHGGAQAAVALRSGGYDGTIAIIGDESEMPYERPPLSKAYLSGASTFDKLLMRPVAFWDTQQVRFHLGERVMHVNPDRKVVTLNGGESIQYGNLIWSAGAQARRLSCPGGDLENVTSIRDRADIEYLKSRLTSFNEIVVIGGGYIGLESAAVLTKLNKKVTLLEAQNRVLARVAGEELSRFFEAKHRSAGVDIRLNVGVRDIVSENGLATGVRLESGEILPCDCVIVGIGILPNIEALTFSGVEVGNGVHVDKYCRTNLQSIYAIGDCAAHQNSYAPSNDFIRIESVQNAVDMANSAASCIIGSDRPYNSLPRFWSDQYNLKLQTLGLSIGHDETCIRGSMNEESFTVVYLKNKKAIAVDCVNNPKDFAQAKNLITNQLELDIQKLQNTEYTFKEFS